MPRKFLSFLALAALSMLARAADPAPALMGVVDIPSQARVGQAQIGGLSGLDWDDQAKKLYFIADDEAAHFFTATLTLDSGRADIAWTSAGTLRICGDTQGAAAVPSDGESIRRDPRGGLVWSSEGRLKAGIGPSVTFSSLQGRCEKDLALPAMLRWDPAGATGPRHNKVFEGLSWSADQEFLWVAMEDALIQDGPVSDLRSGGMSRLSRFDRQGRLVQQIAYHLDTIQAEGVGGMADNGVSEILADSDGSLLVLERSGARNAQGLFDFYCRLYRIAPAAAPDVREVRSLRGQERLAAAKKLLLDFSRMPGMIPFNMEGMSWGPKLADGRRTLLFISDNNVENLPSRLAVFTLE